MALGSGVGSTEGWVKRSGGTSISVGVAVGLSRLAIHSARPVAVGVGVGVSVGVGVGVSVGSAMGLRGDRLPMPAASTADDGVGDGVGVITAVTGGN